MTNPDPLGEPAAVTFTTTVYMGEVLRGWSEDEREKFHNGDDEALKAAEAAAADLARKSIREGLGDVEVLFY